MSSLARLRIPLQLFPKRMLHSFIFSPYGRDKREGAGSGGRFFGTLLGCLMAATLNIATCSPAHGHPCPYPDFERELKDYIGQQKEHHFSVVYNQCLDITSNGRMVLVFPLTIYKSLDLPDQRDPVFDRDFEQWPGIPVMLDYDFNGCIDNIAKLQAYKRGFFISEVLSGGIRDGCRAAETNEQNNKAPYNALFATE